LESEPACLVVSRKFLCLSGLSFIIDKMITIPSCWVVVRIKRKYTYEDDANVQNILLESKTQDKNRWY
jgi:hypothetical protein